jgi:hypothetical protein
MVRPIQRVEEADTEWRAWRKELEVRHKLTQDEKEYAAWRCQHPQPAAATQKQRQLISFSRQMTIRFRQRYAKDE